MGETNLCMSAGSCISKKYDVENNHVVIVWYDSSFCLRASYNIVYILIFDDIIHHSHTLRGAGIFTNFTGCRKSLIEMRLCQNLDSLDFVVICGDFIDIFRFLFIYGDSPGSYCDFIGLLRWLIGIKPTKTPMFDCRMAIFLT